MFANVPGSPTLPVCKLPSDLKYLPLGALNFTKAFAAKNFLLSDAGADDPTGTDAPKLFLK